MSDKSVHFRKPDGHGRESPVRRRNGLLHKSQGNREKVVTTFGDLPPELQLKIFSHLPKGDLTKRMALVCRAWRKLTQDGSLWKEVTLNRWMVKTTERTVELIEQMGQLEKVTLEGWEWGKCADDILDALGDNCANLVTLVLNSAIIRRLETLDMFIQKCVLLREVNLDLCRIPKDARHVLDCLSGSKHLTKLSFPAHENWRPLDMSIPRSYPKLTEVFLGTSMSPCDDEVRVVIDNAGRQLRKLEIARLVRAESFILLGQCQELEELHMIHMLYVTDEGLLNGVGHLHRMSSLSITYAKSLSTYALCVFFSLPLVVGHLQSLDLSFTAGVDDTCISAISSTCPRLTKLHLGGCYQITPSALSALLRNCPRLHYLSVMRFSNRLTDAVLTELRKIQPNLEIHRHVSDDA